MPVLLVKPRYAQSLWRRGLRSVPDYLSRLDGVPINRHHHREVSWLAWDGFQGFLKKQFHVPWRDYWSSWWAGFGWVSRMEREWRVLHLLRERGILCPEPVAVGTLRGQSFLLLRSLTDCVDLPTFLCSGADPARRWRVFKRLGERIADLHDAGFDHPDLYAKHVFIHLKTEDVGFVDFQRTSRHLGCVPWTARWRDLAALHASIDDSAVTPTERVLVLIAYLRRSEHIRCRPLALRGLLAISRRARQLLHRRKVQALRRATAITGENVKILQFRVPLASTSPTQIPRAVGEGRMAC